MGLSTSLNNALSGLNASARGAQVVSSNISNALTEGYGKRTLETSARNTGGFGSGVRVDGVRRDTDAVLISDRRLAEAAMGEAETRADGLSRIQAAMGTPDEADSIAGRIAALESSLVAAASRPDSTVRLSDVLSSAQGVATSIRAASDDIQALRMSAETEIANTVETLNSNLARIAELNSEIRSNYGTTSDINALYDQRQVLVDEISEIVPLRQLTRDGGMIALYSQTGACLLDGRPGEFGFSKSTFIVANATIENGALSALTLNGQPVRAEGDYAAMGGGKLGALFEQRDVLATAAHADLDALARDLIERFSDPALDPTLAAGAAGLFNDNGAAFNPVDEVGLADRIRVNDVVNPDAGGEIWRLRDGLGAATEGLAGDSTLLNAFSDALSAGRALASGSLAGQTFSATDLANETLSKISAAAQRAINEEGFSTARHAALKEIELGIGVDTDAELQDLMLFEQAYAANAKVMQAVDEMINMLMEI